jgi:hypothetical protein
MISFVLPHDLPDIFLGRLGVGAVFLKTATHRQSEFVTLLLLANAADLLDAPADRTGCSFRRASPS